MSSNTIGSTDTKTMPIVTRVKLSLTIGTFPNRNPAPTMRAHLDVLDQALACARRIAKLRQRAAEDTKRILNVHLERAVLATLDFALTAEDRSFTSPELRANLDRLLSRES